VPKARNRVWDYFLVHSLEKPTDAVIRNYLSWSWIVSWLIFYFQTYTVLQFDYSLRPWWHGHNLINNFAFLLSKQTFILLSYRHAWMRYADWTETVLDRFMYLSVCLCIVYLLHVNFICYYCLRVSHWNRSDLLILSVFIFYVRKCYHYMIFCSLCKTL